MCFGSAFFNICAASYVCIRIMYVYVLCSALFMLLPADAAPHLCKIAFLVLLKVQPVITPRLYSGGSVFSFPGSIYLLLILLSQSFNVSSLFSPSLSLVSESCFFFSCPSSSSLIPVSWSFLVPFRLLPSSLISLLL